MIFPVSGLTGYQGDTFRATPCFGIVMVKKKPEACKTASGFFYDLKSGFIA